MTYADTIPFEDVIAAIRAGVCDNRQNEVWEALQVRQALRSAQCMQHMRVGARVVTTPNVKPKHRQLKWATILELRPKAGKVVLKFDDRPEDWIWPAAELIVKQGDEHQWEAGIR